MYPHFQKPRLVRVRDTMVFNFLRSLLDGFAIEVPKAISEEASFDSLHRRMVACGATVTGEGLRETAKPITHIIITPAQSRENRVRSANILTTGIL